AIAVLRPVVPTLLTTREQKPAQPSAQSARLSSRYRMRAENRAGLRPEPHELMRLLRKRSARATVRCDSAARCAFKNYYLPRLIIAVGSLAFIERVCVGVRGAKTEPELSMVGKRSQSDRERDPIAELVQLI